MIAGFEIDGDERIWLMLQILQQHFLRHVIIVEFVVAKGHVDIQCSEVGCEKVDEAEKISSCKTLINILMQAFVTISYQK